MTTSSVPLPEPATGSPAPIRLFALLVGINQYQHVRPLSGPVADVRAVEEYLRSQPDFALFLEKLTDDAATKTAVIAGFENHLAQATAADTVFFYFSGHGTQETADTSLWTAETDGQLECLVCYDGDRTQPHEFLLADKELRYLIGNVARTGAHVVVMADCCHAGDNTRNFPWLETSLAQQDVRERRLTQTAPQRPYEGFFFHDRLSEEILKSDGVGLALPLGAHVQLAACEADESAVEVQGEGVFTKNLLRVLRASGGAISYGALHNRVRQYLRFGFEQQPRIAALGLGDAAPERLQTLFLNRPGRASAPMVEVIRNDQGWLLDVGAIHGVGQTTGPIQLLDPATGQTYAVGVTTIGADFTVLDLPEAVRNSLQPDRLYHALVPGLLTQPVRVHFENETGSPAELVELLAALTEQASASFVPEEGEVAADFTLHVRHGLYFLTRPNDPDRPLIRPVVARSKAAYTDLAESLRHLARWQYLKGLRNPQASSAGLTLEVEPQGQPAVRLPGPQPEAVELEMVQQAGQWRTTVDVRMTNPTDQPFYCTVLYLWRDFASATSKYGVLEPNTRLEPGQTVHLGAANPATPTGREARLVMGLEEVVRQYNWPSVTEYFQFILTKKPLSETTLAFLTLEALPSPPTLQDRLDEMADRGGVIQAAPKTDAFPDWWTQRVALRTKNPLFNKISDDELHQRLEPTPEGQKSTYAADTLADFTLRLYYDVVPDATGQPSLALKPGIEVLAGRGLWMDVKLAVANTIANKMRMRQYEQDLLRYRNRTFLVAKGDSWFQYPFLVRDILDYLSRVFNVYPLASAGDTLRHYYESGDFLPVIQGQKPDFFLISGGGNDILGEQFQDFLRDKPDLSLPFPDRYVLPSLKTALDALQDTYRKIFGKVRLADENVKIIVHGYDYILPIDTVANPRQSSWLGKYMVARGMADQAEREALIHYILVEFNERLRAVAAEFPQVSYLDLRGTVPRTDRREEYWFDEIHPNDKGFLGVSAKFVERINELQKAGK